MGRKDGYKVMLIMASDYLDYFVVPGCVRIKEWRCIYVEMITRQPIEN